MAIPVEQLEAEISKLNPQELAKFRAWFSEFDSKAWDQQIERDASKGKLAGLAEAALREQRNDSTKPL